MQLTKMLDLAVRQMQNLINIISIELMTSSARDASFKSPKTPINDGNMELRILQFKENIFHFPI